MYKQVILAELVFITIAKRIIITTTATTMVTLRATFTLIIPSTKVTITPTTPKCTHPTTRIRVHHSSQTVTANTHRIPTPPTPHTATAIQTAMLAIIPLVSVVIPKPTPTRTKIPIFTRCVREVGDPTPMDPCPFPW